MKEPVIPTVSVIEKSKKEEQKRRPQDTVMTVSEICAAFRVRQFSSKEKLNKTFES